MWSVAPKNCKGLDSLNTDWSENRGNLASHGDDTYLYCLIVQKFRDLQSGKSDIQYLLLGDADIQSLQQVTTYTAMSRVPCLHGIAIPFCTPSIMGNIKLWPRQNQIHLTDGDETQHGHVTASPGSTPMLTLPVFSKSCTHP